MTECCVCPAAGFCERRQQHIPVIHHKRCKAGQCDLIDKLYLRPLAPQPPKRWQRLISPKTRYGYRLAQVIYSRTGEQVNCNECQNEIGRLNLMTSEQILADLDAIATGIVNRGREKSRAWWQRWACKLAPEYVKAEVKTWILEALSDPRDGKEGIGEWESKIRHLTMHIYPTKHQDSWKWNCDQLKQRWSLFNGRRIVAIATDRNTVGADAVRQYLEQMELDFDHILEAQNRRAIREVATWVPMVSLLEPDTANDDEVVFSCHAKGVRHTHQDDHIRKWAEIMWSSCLDYWPLAEAQLKGHVATGSFKRYNNFNTPGNHRWHYSGTFFWWRLKSIGCGDWRKIDNRFFGTESWLGHQCTAADTGCLFLDQCDDLYNPQYWESEVWPKWLAWQQQNYSLKVSLNDALHTV